jgi:hypothetical protein
VPIIVPSSLLHQPPLPVIPVLVSPHFHPTSCCSGRWLGVMWRSWPVVSSPLWGGAGSSLSALMSLPHLAIPCHCHRSANPARSCSQQRLRLWLRLQQRWWYLAILSPSSFCHCCLSSHCSGGWPSSSSSSCPSLLVVVRRVVPVPQSRRLPTIHPASSGGGCWIPYLFRGSSDMAGIQG